MAKVMTTITLGGKDFDVVPTNEAVKIYGEQFRGKTEKPYTGELIHDLLETYNFVKNAEGGAYPQLSDMPQLAPVVWAMAKSAGSTRSTWEKFSKWLDGAPANMYEPTECLGMLIGDLGEHFFRLPKRLGDAEQPDQEQ